GMFPIDSAKNDYDTQKMAQFDALLADKNIPWTLQKILPKVLVAGQSAGVLTAVGAKLLDLSGNLQAGIVLCPPEGDAGTGMTATNSVAPRTGNVSAGTSIFAMAVLENPLSRLYPEIDMVATPTGKPVAMVHCNNCTSDLDAWVKLFKELNTVTGANISTAELYDALYAKALEGDADCGGVLSYNYFSGEPVTGFDAGHPLLVRTQDCRFSLANFMRAQLFATMGSLKIGMDILFEKEHVTLDKLYGQGGLFKTKIVGQRLMAAAMHTPVAVMKTAGEGGAWGIALLAAYLIDGQGQSLETFLATQVFGGDVGCEIAPDAADVAGFTAYLQRYKAGFAIEKAAVAAFN
ncbi:MAG: FGGY-family carbohydrate kinase, partial [Ruthenibacterium sp.]